MVFWETFAGTASAFITVKFLETLWNKYVEHHANSSLDKLEFKIKKLGEEINDLSKKKD